MAKNDLFGNDDSIEIKELSEMEYIGNFSIKYYSRSQLDILQNFFGVRRSKFDMSLLEKRPDLLKKLIAD